MTPRRSDPPLWFLLCVAVALAAGLRAVLGVPHDGLPDGGHPPQVLQGFFAILFLIGGLIWKGVEIAGRVTLEVLKWVVINLSLVVTKLANGLKVIGQGVLLGLKKTWEFFKLAYDKVLKPALTKFWKLYDKFAHWLDHTFGPLLKFIQRVRDAYLCFYKTWVRPWLDLIDVTRRALKIFSGLGLKWAKALDQKLGWLEEKIDAPFRFVLAKINEVINIVNLVITANGLIQRVALIRSLERDFLFAWRSIANPWSKLLTGDDRQEVKDKLKPKTLPTIASDTRAYIHDHSGPNAALLDEMAVIWRNYLRSR